MATNENRRRRNIVPRLRAVLAHLPVEDQIKALSCWMPVDTLEAIVARWETANEQRG